MFCIQRATAATILQFVIGAIWKLQHLQNHQDDYIKCSVQNLADRDFWFFFLNDISPLAYSNLPKNEKKKTFLIPIIWLVNFLPK